MRIISGKYKNKEIYGYNVDGTRPTQSMIREAIIHLLYDYLDNSIFLDVFAGTGAVGYEALSNGAKKIILNDINRECIRNLYLTKENLNLKDNECQILNKSHTQLIKSIKEPVDIVFLDPPYKKINLLEYISLLLEHKLIKDGGIILIESTIDEGINLELIKIKQYRDKKIFIYKVNYSR